MSSTRFLRDVAASVVATALATGAISFAVRDPAPTPSPHEGKFDDRLAWQVEDVPTRDTRVYDAVAMFAMPQAQPHAWSEPSAPVERVAELSSASHPLEPSTGAMPSIVQAEAVQRHHTSVEAVLPPRRPIVLARAEPSTPLRVVPARAAEPASGRQPVRLLGWKVPGSDLLPTGRQTMAQVASIGQTALALGGDVADLGGSLVERVGLR